MMACQTSWLSYLPLSFFWLEYWDSERCSSVKCRLLRARQRCAQWSKMHWRVYSIPRLSTFLKEILQTFSSSVRLFFSFVGLISKTLVMVRSRRQAKETSYRPQGTHTHRPIHIHMCAHAIHSLLHSESPLFWHVPSEVRQHIFFSGEVRTGYVVFSSISLKWCSITFKPHCLALNRFSG